jgi:hypothetical protein
MTGFVLAASLTLGINATAPPAQSETEGDSQPAKLLTGLATKQPVKLVTLDLAVPDSPAFAILGLSPEKIARPGVPRDLATTLLNGVDRRGNLQSGIAMDFAPLFLFAGNHLTYDQYKNGTGTRLLGRTQISVATAKGAGEGDKAVRMALGVRTTLWDAGDPRLDETLVACLNSIRVTPPAVALLDQEAIDAWIAKATAERRPLVAQCHEQFKARRWNASSFAVGIAPSWHSPSGGWGGFRSGGAALWGSLALGLSRAEQFASPAGNVPVERPFGQIVVQVRYRTRELVPNKTVRGTFFEQDAAAAGARFTVGSADRAAVVEAEIAHQMPEVGDTTTALALSLGGQMKLTTGVWLSLAVGANRGGSPNEERSAFVLSSFKWALSREPSLTPTVRADVSPTR